MNVHFDSREVVPDRIQSMGQIDIFANYFY